MGIGSSELLIVLLILVLIFGASRLPALGEGIGKAIKSLKRGLASDDEIEVTPKSHQVPPRSSAEKVGDVVDAEIAEKK